MDQEGYIIVKRNRKNSFGNQPIKVSRFQFSANPFAQLDNDSQISSCQSSVKKENDCPLKKMETSEENKPIMNNSPTFALPPFPRKNLQKKNTCKKRIRQKFCDENGKWKMRERNQQTQKWPRKLPETKQKWPMQQTKKRVSTFQQEQLPLQQENNPLKKTSSLKDLKSLSQDSRQDVNNYMSTEVLGRSISVLYKDLEILSAGLLIIPFKDIRELQSSFPSNLLAQADKRKFQKIKLEIKKSLKSKDPILFIQNSLIPNFRRIGFLKIQENNSVMAYHLFPILKYLMEKNQLQKVEKIMIPFYDTCDIKKLLQFAQSLISIAKDCPSIVFATDSEQAFETAKADWKKVVEKKNRK